jgi:hypothetical protein
MPEHLNLDSLASLDLSVDLPPETLHAVADLVLRLHQRSAREHGAILNAHMLRTYQDRSETERLGFRSAVRHVLHALLLLDVVQLRQP